MTSYLRQKFQSTFLSGSSEDHVKEDPTHLDYQNKQDMEQSQIGIMRALVEAQDPSAKDADDYMIRRFLRARDLDVDKASAMFLKYLRWRKEFVPKGFISPSEIPNDLAHDKLFVQGHDKTGRPIVLVFASRHKPSTSSVEEFKRFVTFSLDKICARSLISFDAYIVVFIRKDRLVLRVLIPTGHEKFTAIADLEGWGYGNSDIRGYLAALSILQDYYPERLGKFFIIHVPYIFMTAWKMIYPFIDKNTKRKIIFVEDKKLLPTLLQDVDADQLPVNYGGKLTLVPIQDC